MTQKLSPLPKEYKQLILILFQESESPQGIDENTQEAKQLLSRTGIDYFKLCIDNDDYVHLNSYGFENFNLYEFMIQ